MTNQLSPSNACGIIAEDIYEPGRELSPEPNHARWRPLLSLTVRGRHTIQGALYGVLIFQPTKTHGLISL